MADKTIDSLDPVSSVNASDAFVLQHEGEACKCTGATLEAWLLSMAQGHGGIVSIAKTGSSGTNPVVDTYTITYADTTTSTFTVANGVKGDTGARTYVWIRYSAVQPTQNSDMGTTPDAWMGIYTGTTPYAPASYTWYTWYKIKGEASYVWAAYSDADYLHTEGNPIYFSPTTSTKSIGYYNGASDTPPQEPMLYNWVPFVSGGSGTLEPTGVIPGTYGANYSYSSSVKVPRFTVDEYGRITEASEFTMPRCDTRVFTIGAGSTSGSSRGFSANSPYPEVASVQCYELVAGSKASEMTPVEFTYYISADTALPRTSGTEYYFSVAVRLAQASSYPVIVVIAGNFGVITH